MTAGARVLRAAFFPEGHADRIALALALLTAGLVLFNTTTYDESLGYDALEHARYVTTLAEGRLPDPRDTREFFSPPLPYVLPALLIAAGIGAPAALKVAQWTNVVFSLGLSVVLLLLCRELRPGRRMLGWLCVFLLGTLPVYHRSFSFFRAEPLLTLLSALALLLTLRLFNAGEDEPWRARAASLGAVFGLMLLTRQQAVFVIGAASLLALLRALVDGRMRRRHLAALALAIAIGAAVGGWFYASLAERFGTPLAFNKKRAPLSLANRPGFFYYGRGDGLLFSDPVRPSFKGQFFPVLYADTWGDYYGYFLLYAWDERKSRYIPPWEWETTLEEKRDRAWLVTNRFSRAGFLGRVNLVSLLPSGLLLVGLARGVSRVGALVRPAARPADVLPGLLSVAVLLTLAGYFVLLLTLPYPLGTTIKGVYALQVFPLLALLGADAAARLEQRSRAAFLVLAAALVGVALHNAPALVNVFWDGPGSTWESETAEDS